MKGTLGGYCLLFLVASASAAPLEVVPYGILDGVIENVINGLRENLSSLAIPDIDVAVNQSGIVLGITSNNVTTQKLDNFTIVALKTTLLPLRLDQLILSWDDLSLDGLYNLSGVVDIDALQGPVEVYGSGTASILLSNLTVTLGASFNSANGHIQIKDILELTVSLASSKVSLENILGGGDMAEIINVFLGFFLTEFIKDSGPAIIEALEPTLKDELNKILADIDFP